MVMNPAGLGTKTYCAGKDQQQCSSQSEQSGQLVGHDSQSHEKVKYGQESRGTRNQE
jgi:hypothetical protein